jgi:hypothetical protein
MLYPIHTHTAAACVRACALTQKRRRKKVRLVYESNCSSVALNLLFFSPSKERRRNTRPFFTRPQGNTIGGYVKELPTTPTTIKTQNSKNKSRNISELQKWKRKKRWRTFRVLNGIELESVKIKTLWTYSYLPRSRLRVCRRARAWLYTRK